MTDVLLSLIERWKEKESGDCFLLPGSNDRGNGRPLRRIHNGASAISQADASASEGVVGPEALQREHLYLPAARPGAT